MKIGILGGTFNPIHSAHIYIAEKCREFLCLDKVILIPTHIPPHKSAKELADANQRLEMCKLAIREYPHFEVCDYEIIHEGKSYTYKTLEYFTGAYPDGDFYLIMGADMFMTVQDWSHPHKIYRMAILCAAERGADGFNVLEAHAAKLKSDGARCIIMDIEPLGISSTMIRDAIKAGEDVSGMLNPDVWEYIRKNGLYGG